MPILQSSTWPIFAVVAAAGCSPSAGAVRRPAVPPSNQATANASTVPKKPGVRPLHVVSLEMTEDTSNGFDSRNTKWVAAKPSSLSDDVAGR